MTIRFLQVTESAAPGFPFVPGQVIHLTGITPEVQRWIGSGSAEVVNEEPEAAIVESGERAVLPRAKRRELSRGV